jgi:hypothetical protein
MNCVQLIRILFSGGENFFNKKKKKTPRPDGVHSRPDGDVRFYFPDNPFLFSHFFSFFSLFSFSAALFFFLSSQIFFCLIS